MNIFAFATSSYLFLLLFLLTLFPQSMLSFKVMLSPVRTLTFVTVKKCTAASPHFMKCSRYYCSSDAASNAVESSPIAPPSTATKSSDLELLEIRIGQITEVVKHPEADSLYIEKVNLGEESGPRTIVSGLVKFITAEKLLNRKVVVLCNLKSRKFVGVSSEGMLLCASNADHTAVEPLTPPPDCPIGEMVQFAGHTMRPVDPGNKAAKAFAKIGDKLVVNDQGVATFDNIPFTTSVGPITCDLKGKIS
jgi:methionine--tRNA ligase beta chain